MIQNRVGQIWAGLEHYEELDIGLCIESVAIDKPRRRLRDFGPDNIVMLHKFLILAPHESEEPGRIYEEYETIERLNNQNPTYFETTMGRRRIL